MNFTLTVNFGEATLAVLTQIARALSDQPITPALPTIDASMIPGTQDGVTLGNDVPSAADVHPLPTVPAAPQAGVPTPPSVEPSPASPSEPEAAATSAETDHAGDVDSRGLPWDGRIHSETKAKIGDGTWRKRRGVDPVLVAQVEAELSALVGNDAPGAESSMPAAPSIAEPEPTPAVPAPPVPAPVPQPPVAAAGGADDFQSFFTATYLPAIKEGRISSDAVMAAVAQLGIPTVMVLKQRPELIPQFKTLMGLE